MSKIIQGPQLIGVKPALNAEQKAVIDVLKETLADALEGKVTSLGVILVKKGGYEIRVAGHQVADLFMGAGSMQQRMLDVIELGSGRVQQ